MNMLMYRLENGKIANYDEVAEIHYGVIGQNSVCSEALDDIICNGTDIHYEGALQDVKDIVKGVLADEESMADTLGNDALKYGLEYNLSDQSEDFVQGLLNAIASEAPEDRWAAAESYIDDEFGQDWESDSTSYWYESDGYQIRYNSGDGDMFVIKSPYYTMAEQCSPCAPNAGYCVNAGGLKTYCLGPDWFDEYNPIPHNIYRVSDGSLVAEVKAED